MYNTTTTDTVILHFFILHHHRTPNIWDNLRLRSMLQFLVCEKDDFLHV